MAPPPTPAAACVQLTLCHDGAGDALLTVTPPETGPPARKCVVAVVDVSYSMHGPANDRGAEVARYFSKLDVVKHGLRTALAGMGDDDVFALVEFSSQARVLLPPQRLAGAGRTAAGAAVDSLAPQGATALWAGMRAGLDALRDAAAIDAGALPVLLLLTDGDPSESPAEGEVAAYKAHTHALGLDNVTLWAMGFGYDGARPHPLDACAGRQARRSAAPRSHLRRSGDAARHGHLKGLSVFASPRRRLAWRDRRSCASKRLKGPHPDARAWPRSEKSAAQAASRGGWRGELFRLHP